MELSTPDAWRDYLRKKIFSELPWDFIKTSDWNMLCVSHDGWLYVYEVQGNIRWSFNRAVKSRRHVWMTEDDHCIHSSFYTTVHQFRQQFLLHEILLSLFSFTVMKSYLCLDLNVYLLYVFYKRNVNEWKKQVKRFDILTCRNVIYYRFILISCSISLCFYQIQSHITDTFITEVQLLKFGHLRCIESHRNTWSASGVSHLS